MFFARRISFSLSLKKALNFPTVQQIVLRIPGQRLRYRFVMHIDETVHVHRQQIFGGGKMIRH